MLNLNPWEVGILVVLAVIIFGPEKLPELARKSARVLKFLRGVANNAQDTVRKELGPEYADLQLSDLRPKNLVRRALADDYDDVVGEIQGARSDLRRAGSDVPDLRGDLADPAATTVVVAGRDCPAPFDPEAT